MGAMLLGSTWPNMIRKSLAPAALAASTYSCVFTDKIVPRTMRAYDAQLRQADRNEHIAKAGS